ncbi:MAG: hypothetical protein ABI610_09770 [Acidobacteriota bacterium]
MFEHAPDFVPELFEREPFLAVGETVELRQSLRQELHAAGGALPPGGLVERRSDLDEALEKQPTPADGGQPFGFPRLVGLEEPAGVEKAAAVLERAALSVRR